jgi:quinol monooxygenase YgiN
MTIARVANFQINLESLDLAKAAIEEFVSAVRDNEPGTLIYLSIQSKDDPAEFLHYMEFADNAAEEIHRQSKAVNKFVEILYPLTVSGVEFHDYSLISSTQPDLR